MKSTGVSWKEKYSVCYTRLELELSCRKCKFNKECEEVQEIGYTSIYDYYNKTKNLQK